MINEREDTNFIKLSLLKIGISSSYFKCLIAVLTP